MYTTKIITSKKEWEALIATFSEANFLQSWNWGEFQKNLDKTVVRIAIVSDKNTVGLAQGVIETAKRGTYLAVAGGPLFNWQNEEIAKYLFDELRACALEHSCVFIRFRPQGLARDISPSMLSSISARTAPMHLTADLTLQLSLEQTDEEILKQMRKNTRSSIRKADTLGIYTELSSDSNEIRNFYEEQQLVAQRQKFVPFSYTFFLEQFKAFIKDTQVCLIHAYSSDKELLSTAFVIFYNKEAVYHYGISTDKNRKLPGSYACQWTAIKEAKKRGCTRYNFWGIVPQSVTNHRFSGVSLFKRGFGGEEVEYLPAHDIWLSWRYWFLFIFETIRRKLRRL